MKNKITPETSDSILIEHYLDGNEIALEYIINKHQQKIFNFIYSKVHDRDISEDIFQETFIKVIKTLKNGVYNEEGKFLPWVMRISHNLVIDFFRKNNRIKTINSKEDIDIFQFISDGSPNAEFWIVDTNQDSAVWSGALAKASGMKLGPTGSVYFVNYQRFLYKDEQGTPKENSEIFKRLNGNATDLDFDSYGNLFVGGAGSTIDVVDINDDGGLTSGVTEAKNLDTLDILSLRVLNDYLYVLTTTVTSDQAIYKMQILDDSGSLGDIELVFDWSSYTNKLSSALCFTLSEAGDLFVGSDSDDQPLTYIQNGNASGFYSSILTAPISYMAWGNSNYLYLINKTEETNRVQTVSYTHLTLPTNREV